MTTAAQVPKRQLVIEAAILRTAPFDYLTASEIFAALQRRLELRYENNLNAELDCCLQKLAKAFERIVG